MDEKLTIPPPSTRETEHLLDLLDPALFTPAQSHGYVDVTMDIKPTLTQLYQHITPDTTSDDPTTAPSYLPHWVLPQAASDHLRRHHQGVAPDLLYARGVPNSPTPDPTSFDKSSCSLLLIEVGFCSDLNLRSKLEEKPKNTNPC